MSEVKEFDVISVGDCVIDCLLKTNAGLFLQKPTLYSNESYVDRPPKMGETMASNNFECLPGGKGANYCIASSRLGSKNAFICKLGDDLFGKSFIDILKKDNINTEQVTFTNTSPTSVASIMVDKNGNNFIAVNFGATLELNEKDLNAAENSIKKSKVLVVSLVIREETALHSLKLAKKHGLLTIFNFAPANKDLSADFNKLVDILVAEVFTGEKVSSVDDAIKVCKIVLERKEFDIGVGVIVTLGGNGAVYGDKSTSEITHFPAKKVQVVDTTGAGDAFVGSLAHYCSKLSQNKLSMKMALQLATEYASISVQGKGTQTSYPKLSDLEAKFNLS